MLTKLKYWFVENNLEITWFLIGFLVSNGLENLARGQYGSAALSFVIAYINYLFRKI